MSEFTSDIVIGLEIHVSLNTKSKLFCSCKNSHTDQPNANICPICLGHPGARPSVNATAIEYALRLAHALKCTIAPKLIFSRKTYFYPDLSKNFQITQYEEPLGTDGSVLVNGKEIGIERIHVEEDPGALQHKSSHTIIDYNRSGSPLCEIVTKPDMTSAEEARAFIKKLLSIVNYLDIFDYANGTIKADLNISIKESGYCRVEIKGVSGFKDIQDALEYEILRQQQHPSEVVQETRGYDNLQKVTVSQRLKETEEDYGYIYETDILPRPLEDPYVERIRASLPEMIDERIDRYTEIGLKQEDAETIASIREISDVFDDAIKDVKDAAFVAKYFKREVISLINDGLIIPADIPSRGEQLKELVTLFAERKINNHTAREVARLIAEQPELDVGKHLEENDLIVLAIDLPSVCAEVIKENQQAADDYLSGKYWAANYLVGMVMKKVKGQAMPDDVKEELHRQLDAMK